MANLDEKLEQYASSHTTVPEPRPTVEPRQRRFTLVSVDDHLLEPPETFEGRMPAKFADQTPHVERDDDGNDHWIIGDTGFPLMGMDAIVTWEPKDKYLGPVNYDQIRPATFDVDARVADMDISGVAASLNFPSAPFGFAGQRFMRMADPELGLACMRAYNDWVLEGWAGPHPDRIIASQVTWMPDPEIAAQEVRRNAERGFKAVTFSENPEKLGLPSVYSTAWDPFFRACEETGTVINLHVGSSSETLVPSSESPPEVLGILFPVNAFSACVDWLYAKVGLRFPDIKIALSESGIGWVPLMLDRLDYMSRHGSVWDEPSMTPVEVFRRNFWLSSFYDPLSYALRDEIGVDRIMLEMDYPHWDSSWPNTQAIIGAQLEGFTQSEIDRVTHTNACELYRHPVPEGWGAPAATAA
jgi:predicted TIM-barrel fold metal-dependent hydrolase